MTEIFKHLRYTTFIVEAHDRERTLDDNIAEHVTVDRKRCGPSHCGLAEAEIRSAEEPHFVDLTGVDVSGYVLFYEDVPVIGRVGLVPPSSVAVVAEVLF